MSWNYRIIRRTIGDEHQYGLHETYYNEDGSLGFSQDPDPVIAEEQAGLATTLEWMKVALSKPVIDYDTAKEIV